MVHVYTAENNMPRRISVKSAAAIAEKWADVTPGKLVYYAAEAPAAGAEWEANTVAAGGIYTASLAQAGIGKRFVGGVKRAGAAKFARKVKDVGVARYGPGVAAAKSDMAAGVAPYVSALEGLEIPDRGPRGSPGNYAIVQVVGAKLHAQRLAELAATG